MAEQIKTVLVGAIVTKLTVDDTEWARGGGKNDVRATKDGERFDNNRSRFNFAG